MKKKTFRNNLLVTGVVFLLPVVTFLILGPLEIYVGNVKDFGFALKDFYGWMVLLALVFWALATLVVSLLPEKINRVAAGVVLCLGVGGYLQNMIFNQKLSENDGSAMRWDEMGQVIRFNTIIWAVLLAVLVIVLVIFRKKISSVMIGIAAALIVMQLVAVVSLFIGGAAKSREADFQLQLSGEKQFEVASGDNIVIFVLDTYGNTVLERVIEEYPDALDAFHDFTYYSNADCHYYCTFPSMTHMFTGNEFDFDANSVDWMNTSWQSEKAAGFFDSLHERGYTCNLYSSGIGYVYGNLENLAGKFDNVQNIGYVVTRKGLITRFTKMSIYRGAPYILKPYFEVLTSEFNTCVALEGAHTVLDHNEDFFAAISEKGLAVDPDMQNALIIEHLFGIHAPYTIDETGAASGAETTQEIAARGNLSIVEKYLEAMKEAGVYDSATIIVTADHGSWYGDDPQPIFFVKRAGETHSEMPVSTAPVSLDDMQATILTLIGADAAPYGKAVFDWKDGETREREVFMRITDEAYPEVEGSSWNVYYGYTYSTDKKELLETMADGPDMIKPATPW